MIYGLLFAIGCYLIAIITHAFYLNGKAPKYFIKNLFDINRIWFYKSGSTFYIIPTISFDRGIEGDLFFNIRVFCFTVRIKAKSK